ncbi:C-C motif chemokine 5-like [Pseudonaja textilis]|uniref:C-C motif chemokine 5-like n=1 Tax=Pseudonaja textilis TaxID=8673 RepID=UPI000EA8E9F2|nr:C-C motif chemokine 5-like [Pseudonaja textilis]
MNSFLATLTIFLVGAMFLSQTQAQYESILLVCCFDYVKRPLPETILKSFEQTEGRCSMPAVVFITKKDRRICADPSEQWVQDRMQYLSQN